MKSKLSLFIIVMLVLVSAFSSVTFAAEGDTWISPVDSSVGPSESFDIEIHMDTGGNEIGAFNMYLDFDASEVTADVSSGENALSKGVDATDDYLIMSNADDIGNGHFRFAGICAQNCANGSDVHLVTIHLQTTAAFNSGSSNLSLRLNELADELGTSVSIGNLTDGTVTSNVLDETAPVRSGFSPSSDLTSGTTQTTISLTTDEDSTCKYGTIADTGYATIASTFSTTGGMAHSATVTGLSDGNSYNYYVRCEDESTNINTDDASISFTVVSDTSVPVRTSFAPTGTLSSGTTQATLSLTTNENATCKYGTTAGTAYASISNAFTTTGATVHSANLTGLASGSSYNYYVRCVDDNGNTNTTDSTMSFSIAAVSATPPSTGGGGGGSSVDTTPPVISNGTPSGTLATETTETTVAVQTNENSVCKYSTEPNISYANMDVTLTTIGGTAHSIAVDGLTAGSSYNYYILCQNTRGLISSDAYVVAFSVLTADGQVPDPIVPVITPVVDPVVDPLADFTPTTLRVKERSMYQNLKGKILLKVEDNGRAYYMHPQEEKGFYLGRPRDAFRVMREQGIGIKTADLMKIPFGFDRLIGEDSDGDGLPDLFEDAIGTDKNKADTDGDGYSDKDELIAGYSPIGEGKTMSDAGFTGKHMGKIFLQIEGSGEAWYVHDNKRYYLGRPDGAFEIMRHLSLGISNENFDKFVSEE